MSQENVDRAWSIVGNLEALFDLFDEEIVWDVSGLANPPLRFDRKDDALAAAGLA